MAIYSIICILLKTVLMYLAVYVFKDLLYIYCILIGLDLMHMLVYNVLLMKNGVYINPFKISVPSIKKILAYSLPMGIYVITNSFNRDLDKMVIARLADIETLAIYTNCSKVLPFDFLATKKRLRDFFSKAFVFELIKIFHNTIIAQVILSLQYHFTFIFLPIYSQFTFNLLSQYSHNKIPSIYLVFFYLKNIKIFINFHKTKIKLRKKQKKL